MTSRRNTIQKDLVRNTVYEMRRHVTANEVYEFVKEFCPTIGKGTVYRNLDILVEEGNLRKVEEVKDEEQESYENLPESLQYGERGEQMQENVDSLEEFIGYLEETDSLEEM